MRYKEKKALASAHRVVSYPPAVDEVLVPAKLVVLLVPDLSLPD